MKKNRVFQRFRRCIALHLINGYINKNSKHDNNRNIKNTGNKKKINKKPNKNLNFLK
ncbi:hypothetical protein CCYN2B_40143 [Capnocytophaga cynodegmi]|uniref:Uncharacterized protein n=1 Tax=Capnocytophaga cynodegmi TaxID=28189 RepID=A0A0B7HI56_9FLAO|nr:hypothetical protein CCYN2B_40143 [Capnocytophaga cynodegmi]